MINHARTLLMNVDGPWKPGEPGEEFMPQYYRAVPVPPSVEFVRMMLFGRDPDRTYINYRMRQLMTLLHATELEQYVLSLDSRLTYWPNDDAGLFDREFRTTCIKHVGPAADISFIGEPQADDRTGRCRHTWLVQFVADSLVRVSRTTPPRTEADITFTVSSGLSSPIPLAGTRLSLQVRTGHPELEGAAFTGLQLLVTHTGRPQTDLGELATRLQQTVDGAVVQQLFYDDHLQLVEPYASFKHLWEDHPNMPYRLGGLLLACIYRTEAARQT